MGVTVEVYRVRIGSFNGRGVRLKLSSTLPSGVSSAGHGLDKKLLLAGIICILLIIGGIEPNPGPSTHRHTCRVCKEQFKSPSNYCSHVKIHVSYRKSLGLIPCSVPTCGARISTLGSFKTHFKLYHDNQREQSVSASSSSSASARCPVPNCSQLINSRKDHSSHMAEHLRNDQTFNCFLKGCPGTLIHYVGQFRTHNTRYHSQSFSDDYSKQVVSNVLVSTDEPMDTSTLDFDTSAHNSILDDDNSVQDDVVDDDDDNELYPLHAIKDELARFYLRLEAVELLPTSTVQLVADEIKLVSELIHHVLKKNLKKELLDINLQPNQVKDILFKTFSSEPVFNVHHKGSDTQQLGTDHLRTKFWKERFKFVVPREIYFGVSESGKKKCGHFVSVRESLEALLGDPKFKQNVKDSWTNPSNFPDLSNPETILQDFIDGTVFRDHVMCPEHDGRKCLRIFLFQDGFDPNAFSSGNYKPLGFYYAVGNLPPKVRFNLEKIQLALMVLENDLKNSKADELNDFDRLQEALKPLIDDLIDLKTNGIEIDGEKVEVCLMFLIGDSLGQNYIGRYVTNFASSSFSCRYCIMSKADFQSNPEETRALRTPQQYNDYAKQAKRLWLHLRQKALQDAKAKGNRAAARCSAPSKKKKMRDAVSQAALSKMKSVHFRAVKYRVSPFNRKELNFHVVSHQPPCLAHDLFEGLVKKIVALILHQFIDVKKWFDLETLNKRIKSFKPKGSDAADKPKPLKKLDKLYGNAVENWNFLRLAPFIFGDLIQDTEDPFWQMFLLLKELVEYVCAPKISVNQLSYLSSLISDFISLVKEYLDSCLIPKLHYLCHYPELIRMFGPLIRLFTLRFESKHAFFKRVIRACKNYINITHTMSRKYMSRFAYDNSFGGIDDVVYGPLFDFNLSSECEEVRKLLTTSGQSQEMDTVTVYGTTYKKKKYLILDSLEGHGIKLGCIRKIVPSTNGGVCFILEEIRAEKSPLGFYSIVGTLKSHCFKSVEALPDYYPLETYKFQGKDCISLKHSICFNH